MSEWGKSGQQLAYYNMLLTTVLKVVIVQALGIGTDLLGIKTLFGLLHESLG